MLLENNKGVDQTARPRSLVSAFVISYPKSKHLNYHFGGLQHDKVSGYALDLHHYFMSVSSFCDTVLLRRLIGTFAARRLDKRSIMLVV